MAEPQTQEGVTRDQFGGVLVVEPRSEIAPSRPPTDQFGGIRQTDQFGGIPSPPDPEQIGLAADIADFAVESFETAKDFAWNTVAGGVGDAGTALWNSLVTASMAPLRIGPDPLETEQMEAGLRRWAQPIPRPDQPLYQMGRELVRFGAGYATTGGPTAGVLGFTTPATRGLVGGGITDFLFYEPNEPRASNLAQQFYPNPITEALAATGEDSELVGRLKNVAEGGLLGMSFDILASSIGRIAFRRGVKPNEITVSDIREAVEAGDEDAIRLMEQPAVRNAVNMTEAAAPRAPRTRHGPRDLVSWLRMQGGVQDQGSELSAMGITNAPRDMTFARDEQFLGRLINPDGLDLDTATRMAWEAGYLPGTERPEINELLTAIDQTANANKIAQRTWRPGEMPSLQAIAGRDLVEEAEFYGIDPSNLDDIELAGEIDAIASLIEGRTGPVETLADLNIRAPIRGEILSESEKLTAEIAATIDTNLRQAVGRGELDELWKRISQEYAPQIDDARRGTITQEQTVELAHDLGMTVDDLLRRQRGEAFNAETIFAARMILHQSKLELARLARAARGGGDENLVAFQRALTLHVSLQEQVMGIRAEAGRALGQFNIPLEGGLAREQALREMVTNQEADIQQMAAMVDDLMASTDSPGTLARFTRAAYKANTFDQIREIWINGLLTNPPSHMANISGNMMALALNYPENAVAAMFGGLREAATGTQDRIYMSELLARAHGMGQGAIEGLGASWQVLRTNELNSAFAKIPYREGAIPGFIGNAVRTPGRLLNAEDAWFKALAGRMELNALAHRQAIQEGLNGPARAARVQELLANPSDELLEAAQSFANYSTFTDPLGDMGQAWVRAINTTPGFRYLAPFIRTPANITAFAFERTPFGLLMKSVRDNFAAGGAARDLAAARMTVGTGIMTAMAALAQAGYITGGGPSDPGLRADRYNSGWQPYSIRMGDRYYAYRRLEPVAMLAGLGADFVEMREEMSDAEADNIAGLIMGSVSRNLMSKMWTSNLSDFITALSRPEQFGEQWINRFAGSVVPAGVAGIERMQDPYLRDAQNWLDSIYARIPGMSTELPVRLNIWGEPIQLEGALGPDFISPIYTSTVSNDPLMQEVVRLRLGLRMPPRQIRGAQLTPEQYGTFVELAGRPAREALTRMVTNPNWQALSDPQREKLIRDTISRTREAARNRMLRDPALLRAIAEQRAEEAQ